MLRKFIHTFILIFVLVSGVGLNSINANASTGSKIFLPASNKTWTVYKMGHPPVKTSANIAGYLAPAKYGGLTYDILGNAPYANTYYIKTSSFGEVEIYGAPSTGAVITNNGSSSSQASSSSASSGSHHFTGQATAYIATGHHTATGTIPAAGRTIAVDPKVIPLHSRVCLTFPNKPQYNGCYTAEDTGGAIKGNMIDLFVGSKSEAINFGRQSVSASW